MLATQPYDTNLPLEQISLLQYWYYLETAETHGMTWKQRSGDSVPFDCIDLDHVAYFILTNSAGLHTSGVLTRVSVTTKPESNRSSKRSRLT